MNDEFMKDIDSCCKTLALDFSGAELAQLAANHAYSAEVIDAVGQVFCYLQDKKKEATIQMLLKTSRLPQKNIKTFANFDFSILRGKDVERIKALRTLAPVYARKNVAFIGPTGTDKTHYYSNLRYNNNYRLILIGAMPHSAEGKAHFSSIISMLENTDGYAKVIRLCSNSQLKITKTSLRKVIHGEVENGYLAAA